jgi:GNAT superfamily N-acetyltransferase
VKGNSQSGVQPLYFSSMQDFEIRPFGPDDIEAVRVFTDLWIGDNYYSTEELETILLYSGWDGLNASFCAWSKTGELAAVRLTYAPGVWIDETTRGLTPELWDVDPQYVSYFKSLFVADQFQQSGLGKTLSWRSIEVLKQMGAKAIVCHSWIQSPGNSSQIYLQRFGFKPVKEHLKFWYPVDYQCPVCAPARCVCTAHEMIYYL